MTDVGRALVVLGLAIAAIGVVLLAFDRVPWLGRLPGDINIQRGSFTFYFPLTTCILVSALLTLLFWLTGRR